MKIRKGFKAPKLYSTASQSTQMIVGATPSTDADIIKKADSLYKSQGLKRVYYSGYSPIPGSDSRLPAIKPPLMREHRLYQADWLLRFYGFKVNELATGNSGNFSLNVDPKLQWALANRGFFPVDINTASKWELLRIPGLGVRNTKRIIKARKHNALTLADLKKMRVSLNRAKFFIVTADHNPDVMRLDNIKIDDIQTRYIQPSLFDEPVTETSN